MNQIVAPLPGLRSPPSNILVLLGNHRELFTISSEILEVFERRHWFPISESPPALAHTKHSKLMPQWRKPVSRNILNSIAFPLRFSPQLRWSGEAWGRFGRIAFEGPELRFQRPWRKESWSKLGFPDRCQDCHVVVCGEFPSSVYPFGISHPFPDFPRTGETPVLGTGLCHQ